MFILSKRTWAVTGIGLGIMVLGMIWSIVNTALASIQKELLADVLDLQWMMNAFGIFLCVPLLTMGKLGDAYGRKKLFLFGLLGALLASVIAGFASHIGILIMCMGLFGLSGSIILPLSQALLIHQFPENQKEKAVSLWAVFVSISIASGPLVGGFILNFWGWRWVYWINTPIILFVIPVVFFFVKKEKEHHKTHCDWAGVGLLGLTICSFIVGLMQGASWGWGSSRILGLFTLTILSLVLFIRLEKKSKNPLFRPDLFAHRSFLFSAIPNAFMIGFIWVVFFMVPLYLQNILGYPPLHVGLLLLLTTLPVALFSGYVGKLYRKKGAKSLMLLGFSLLIIASFIQAVFMDKGQFSFIAVSCLMTGFGWVLTWSPSISCALSSIPHKAAGIASGMFTTLQELGAVTSLAIAGVFFSFGQKKLLAPHRDSVYSALNQFSSDEIDSLLTNPTAVKEHLGNSPILPWLKTAFIGGYENAFWFLVGISLLAFLFSTFLPKKKTS